MIREVRVRSVRKEASDIVVETTFTEQDLVEKYRQLLEAQDYFTKKLELVRGELLQLDNFFVDQSIKPTLGKIK